MATDNKRPHEHPFPSWYHSLHAYSRASEDLRRQAEQMRQRGRAIRIECDALAKFYQLDINNRLRDRINCNREWLDMLRDMLSHICEVSEVLGYTKIQTDHFIADLGDVMTVNVESITHRDTRQNGDYVTDTVQDELRKEAKMQNDVKNTLQNTIDDAVQHLQTLINIRRETEKTIRDKEEATKIDLDVYNSNEKSAPVGFKPFCDRKVKNHVELQTWDDLFRDLLTRGREHILKGIDLYERLYDELNKAAHKLHQKADEVSLQLRRRIYEENSAIKELEFQKHELEKAQSKLLFDLREWQSSRSAKIANHKLAESRKEARTFRPGLENALDAPFCGLNDECENLIECIDGLDEQIVKGREHLQMVEDRMGELCERIRVTRRSLTVDQTVVGTRKRLEVPQHISYPRCPIVPAGVIRERIKFH